MTARSIARSKVVVAAIVISLIGFVCQAIGQAFVIGIVDFYGLRRISESEAREALTFKEGDTLALNSGRPATLKESEDRLARLPGVARARITVSCCDTGRVIVYVGVEERGAPTMRFRAAPTGPARLADDIVRSGEEFSTALMRAVERGDAAEDRSQGHAFAHNPTTRAIQERFVTYAKRDLSQLRLVLRSSGDAAHRALAALVLGYAPDKQAVVEDLVNGISDPTDEVRNNAMRALLVFADMDPAVSRNTPRIPPEPFIALLSSPVFSDRNKASGALMVLTARRDPELLATLREGSLAALVEMARWKSEGHSLAALTILGRIAGYSDDAAQAAWNRGDREIVIEAAIRQP
jgi:hypothetical protein